MLIEIKILFGRILKFYYLEFKVLILLTFIKKRKVDRKKIWTIFEGSLDRSWSFP